MDCGFLGSTQAAWGSIYKILEKQQKIFASIQQAYICSSQNCTDSGKFLQAQ